MTYTNCHADVDGGAIFVIFNSFVYCNFSSFTNCTSQNKGGAMYIIANNTNITQGCFTQCSSQYGSALYIPLIQNNLSFEGCSIDRISSTNEKSEWSIYASSHDLYLADNNFSSISLAKSPGPFFTSGHMLNNTRLTIYNLNQTGQEKSYVFSFSGVSMNKEVNESNIYGCSVRSGHIFFTTIEQMIFSHFYFTNNNVPEDCYVVGAELQNGALTNFVSCVFSATKAKSIDSSKGTIQTDETVFESVEVTELPHVTSQGCWGHSHYKWTKPNTAVIVLVIIAVALSLVAAFVYVLLNKWKIDKKLAEENASIIENDDPGTSLI